MAAMSKEDKSELTFPQMAISLGKTSWMKQIMNACLESSNYV